MTIRTVAIVGAGLIGASWAAFFLAKGLDVVACDPAADAQTRLRERIAALWPDLQAAGLAPGASPDRLRFEADLETAVQGADFVMENGPERLETKRETFRRIDAVVDPQVLIASSSSALRMGDIQSACARHPERCLIAHPFNPPHIIPLVEIVGGPLTTPDAQDRCQAFFEALGKQCIRLRKEVRGHVANRLAWALYREAVWLVEQGYASAADVDRAVVWGPGLRWAVMGPHLTYHLGGGEGGLEHFFAQFGDTLRELWAQDAVPALTPGLQADLSHEVAAMMDGTSAAEMTQARDRFLMDLLSLRTAGPDPSMKWSQGAARAGEA